MALVFLRKGKVIVILGKEAKPTISQSVSKSNNLQIKSVMEVSRLIGDLNLKEKD